MAKPNWHKSIAITGAGSGFGAALAHKYAAEGWKVAVTDMDEDRANQTFFEIEQLGGSGFCMPLNTTSAKDWRQLHNAIMEQWGGLQILVNNAGVAAAGNFEDTSIEDWEWVLDTDLMGVVRGCHQFAGIMKRQKKGHIVNVASFAGLASLPFISAYGVAKAAVVALSEALRAEMYPYNVGVTVVCPSFVRTGLLDTFRSSEPDNKAMVTRWMDTSGITPEYIASEICKAVDKKQFLVLTHKHTRSAWRMKRWFPERYFKRIVKRS